MSTYSLTLPANYGSFTISKGGYVQLNIETKGAFCIISNTVTFSPALPTGLLAVGKYPNPTTYPMGAQATTDGSCNYTFSTTAVACDDPKIKDIIGKVITVGSGKK
jgi:hypothetical protein